MAVFYARSTDGNNADNGTTWALADATLAGSIAGTLAAGDTLYVSDNHAESTAGAVTLNWPGSVSSPNYVWCGDDAAEPPTALAATATVTTTGNNALTISSASDYVHFYGITFTAGSGAVAPALNVQGALTTVDSCNLRTGGTTAGNIAITGDLFIANNCGIKFASAAGRFSMSGTKAIFSGCYLESGGSSPDDLTTNCADSVIIFNGLDLTNANAAINLSTANGAGANVTFRDCRLPASWSGSLNSGTPGAGSVFEMINCDSGDTTYRYRRATQFGTMRDETTLVRTGGADIDGTGFSWQMVSGSNAEYPALTLESRKIEHQITSVGSAVTLTIHFLRDSATNMTDAEIWMSVQYLGTSGVPLASFISDAKADILATAADQATSSETWTTTGMANPNEQKCNVTFTPQEKGMAIITIHLAKASTTVYVCPKVEQS